MNRDHTSSEQERFDNQVRTYLKVLKQDPRSRVFAPLAALLDRAGHPEQAEKVCRRGLAHNPEFADGHLVLARALYHQKRLADALQAAERALELNPHSADSLATSAECLAALEQHEKAVERCLQALDIDPHNDLARALIKSLGQRAGVAPAKKTTGAFRAAAATAPGRRLGPADLFGNDLAGASQDAIDKVSAPGQPFAALSAGSQPPPAEEEDFAVPTAPARQPHGAASGSTLPPRPQPEAPAEEAAVARGGTANKPLSFSGLSTGGLPLLHLVQSVIERVGEQAPEAADEPLRVPRSGRLTLLLGLALFGLLLYWLLGLAARRSHAPAAPTAAATAAPARNDQGTLAKGSPPQTAPPPAVENGPASARESAPATWKRRRSRSKRRRLGGRRR